MSTTIDKHITEMVFDNSKFEPNVEQSMSTLEKLKSKLNLTGAAKGLSGLSSEANKINFKGLSAAVEGVQNKFTAFDVVAMTVLNRVTNAAIDAGKRIAEALSIRGAKDGFAEYELKMDSVRTIMAATGEDVKVINGYLEELNKYADQTIYSFSDMTQNIGKFTNAGVKLEDAVAAIKGISNEAAVSGANAAEASRAMYNIAQSLSMGYMQYIDWKSIENANMATKEFKTYLADAGVAAGNVKKINEDLYQVNGKSYNLQQLFKDALKDQWLTTDVLITTLKDYADETTEIGQKAFRAAQEVSTFSKMIDALKEAVGSGWAISFEHIFGDKDEATQFWTGINDVLTQFIDKTATSRNESLKFWKESGGRDKAIKALMSAIDSLSKIVGTVSSSFDKMFGKPQYVSTLMQLTVKFEQFTEKLKLSDATLKKIESVFVGFFSAIKVGKNFIVALIDALSPLGDVAGFLIDKFLNLSSKSGDFFTELEAGAGSVKGFQDKLKGIKDALQKFADNLPGYIDTAKEKFQEFKMAISEKVDFSGFQKVRDFFGKTADDSSLLSRAAEFIKKFLESMLSMDKITSVTAFVLNVFSGLINGVTALWNVAKAYLGPVIKYVKDFFFEMSLSDAVKTLAKGGGVALVLKKIGEAIENFGSWKESFDIVGNVTSILQGVSEAFEDFQMNLKTDVMLKVAGSIGILALSLLVLSAIPSESIAQALGAMAVVITEFGVAVGGLMAVMGGGGSGGAGGRFSFISEFFDKIRNSLKMKSEMDSISKLMLKMAASILLLSISVKILGSMDLASVAQGIIGVGVMLLILVKACEAVSKIEGKMAKAAGSMILMAVALNMLVIPITILGLLPFEKIAQGIISVLVLLAGMVVALKFMGAIGSQCLIAAGAMILMSTALTIASVGILVLVGALTALGAAVNNENIHFGAAIGIIVGALTALAFGLTLMSGALPGAAALLVASAALVVLAGALALMGGNEHPVKALLTIGGALIALAIGLTAMLAALPGATALLVAATGLTILAAALGVMGAAADGIGPMIATLMSLLVFVSLLPIALPGAKALLVIDAALTLLGVSVAVIGGAMLVASAGITALSLALEILVGVIDTMDGSSKALLSMTGALFSLLAIVVEFVAALPGAVVITVLAAAFVLLGAGLVVASGGMMAAAGALVVLAGALAVFSTTVATVVIVIREALFGVGKDAREAGRYTIEGYIAGLKSMLSKLKEEAIKVFKDAVEGVKDFLGIHSRSTLFYGLGYHTDEGYADGVTENSYLVEKAMNGLGETAVGSFEDYIGDSLNGAGKDGVLNIAKGIDENSDLMNLAGENLGENLMGSLGETIQNGAGDINLDAITGSLSISEVDGISDMLAGMTDNSELLDMAGLDLSEDVKGSFMPYMEESFGKVGEKAMESMTEPLKNTGSIMPYMQETAKKMKQPFEDLKITYTNIGEESIEGLVNGQKVTIPRVNAAGKDLAHSTEFALRSSMFREYKKLGGDLKVLYTNIGKDTIEGYVNGQKVTIPRVTKAGSDLAQSAQTMRIKMIEEYRKAGTDGVNELAYGMKDSSPKVYKTMEYVGQLGPKGLEPTKNKISIRKIGKEFIEGYIDEHYVQIPRVTKAGQDLASADGNAIRTEMWKQHDKNLRAQDTQLAERMKAAKKIQNGANAETLKEEGVFWTKLKAATEKGINGVKTAGQSLADFKKDIVKRVTDTLNSIDEKTNAFFTKTGLFDEVQKKEAVSGQKLIDNLKGQVNQLNEFAAVVASLSDRIQDGDLASAIADMGIESLAELQALNSMTDEQLTEYAELYHQKYAASSNAANQQVTSQLSAMLGGAKINIEEFKKTFNGSAKSLEKYFKETGQYWSEGLSTGMAAGINDEKAQSDMQEVVDTAVETIQEKSEVSSPSKLFADKVGKYWTEGIAQGMVHFSALWSVNKSVQTIITYVLSNFEKSRNKFVSIGKTITSGLSEGITSNTDALVDAATRAAESAIKAAQSKMDDVELKADVTSSDNKKEDEPFGKFESAIQNSFNTFSKALDATYQPTIKPVMDMSALSYAGNVSLKPRLYTYLDQPIQTLGQMMAKVQNESIASNEEMVAAIYDLKQAMDTRPHNTYIVDGITYDDGSNIQNAVETLVRAARIERRM